MLLACVALASWLQWRARQRHRDDDGLLHAGEMGLRRVVLPVAALVLVMIARARCCGRTCR